MNANDTETGQLKADFNYICLVLWLKNQIECLPGFYIAKYLGLD